MSTSQRFLIDTSAWIETLRTSGDPTIRARVSAVAADDRALLCDLVLVELWNGARASQEHRLLREMEEQIETVPTTPEVWALARELARLARSKGLTVPATDLIIAACAEHHRLGLIHHDTHFDQLSKLRAASS
ncbi:MAG TPA: PIN domain-containing protein [Thermoanaerobaculia bacterium]|nr:PIN domain-containing protein [Thermoanaerobaculia bacterium]